MDITCAPHGHRMHSLWVSNVHHMDITGTPLEYHMYTTYALHAFLMGITCTPHGYQMHSSWVLHVHHMYHYQQLPRPPCTSHLCLSFVLLHTCKLSSKIYILHCKECIQWYMTSFYQKQKFHVELQLLVFIYIQYRIIMYTINYVTNPTSKATCSTCIWKHKAHTFFFIFVMVRFPIKLQYIQLLAMAYYIFKLHCLQSVSHVYMCL